MQTISESILLEEHGIGCIMLMNRPDNSEEIHE